MSTCTTGVLLMAFGGPDSPEAIEPFMKNLMGRTPAPELVEKVTARYGLIGGRSPLPDITREQARQLEQYLCAGSGNYKAAVGMCHWHPFIKEGISELLDNKVDKIIAISLAPFYSKVSTGAYQAELDKAISEIKSNSSGGPGFPEVVAAGPLYDNSLFIDAVAEKLVQGLEYFSEDKRSDIPVVFSAHSLPVDYIKEGDPYVEQFEYAVNKVVNKLHLSKWHIAYQSKGGGTGEWLDPMVEEVMERLREDGCRDVLVVPIGFVSDHIETLYDIDIAQKNHARSIGLNFHRTAALNTGELFIKAMADIVLRKLDR
ncbi:ferrochelatase [Phosphitispora sp. TUW77]|uniref:ferrochelatase n=1 Tax=Phosphitispora sp. TUW77 TaxID=3152361 RepID=UPI003AB3DD59